MKIKKYYFLFLLIPLFTIPILFHKNNIPQTQVSTNVSKNILNLSADEQKVVDAGYGIVTPLNNGNYAVLTHGDGCVNGKDGSTILREYLSTLNLEPGSLGGCWIDSKNDCYWYIARNINERITPDETDFWD